MLWVNCRELKFRNIAFAICVYYCLKAWMYIVHCTGIWWCHGFNLTLTFVCRQECAIIPFDVLRHGSPMNLLINRIQFLFSISISSILKDRAFFIRHIIVSWHLPLATCHTRMLIIIIASVSRSLAIDN